MNYLDNGLVECKICGNIWDGNAQCFPCIDEEEEDIEPELKKQKTESNPLLISKDILKMILEYLSKKDIDNLVLCCHWIKDFLRKYIYGMKYEYIIYNIESFHPEIREYVHIVTIYGDFNTNNLYKILICFPNVTMLHIDEYFGDLKPLNHFKQLIGLTLENLGLCDITPIGNLTQLRYLNLRMFRGFIEPLYKLTNLENLILPFFKGTYDEFIQKLNK